MICFNIPGYCQPKQRTSGKNFSTPKETRAYEKLVKTYASLAMRGKPPLTDYIALDINIFCEIPESYGKKKTDAAINGILKPIHCDLDNCLKAVLDGMNGVVYEDDRRIYKIIASRKFTEGEEGVTVMVSTAPCI